MEKWSKITSGDVKEVRYFKNGEHTIEASIFYKWGEGEIDLSEDFGAIIDDVQTQKINVQDYQFELGVIDNSYDVEYSFPSSMCKELVKKMKHKLKEGFDEDVFCEEGFDYDRSDIWFYKPKLDLSVYINLKQQTSLT